ncbi:MAG: CorA family divalent cation transporter [Thermoplasmata archaeon]
MIRTYVSAGRDIQNIAPVDIEKALWIDVTDPSGDEIRQVADGLNIPLDDIIDSLDPDERPRFEDEEDYYLLMYRVPVPQGQRMGVYLTAPVGFFIREDKLVTVHTSYIDVVSYFQQRKRQRVVETPREILVAILGTNIRRVERFYKVRPTQAHRVQVDRREILEGGGRAGGLSAQQ